MRYNSKLKNSDYEKLNTFLRLSVKTFVKDIARYCFLHKKNCFLRKSFLILNTILKYNI